MPRVSHVHVLKGPFGDVEVPIPLSNLHEHEIAAWSRYAP